MRKLLIILVGIAVLLAALWLARARLAGELAQNYFRRHGIASSVTFGRLGLSGISGRFVLGPPDKPDFSAEAVEVDFDPLRLKPRIVEVRLLHPVVRAQIMPDGKVVLPSLQAWLDSLSSQQERSDYISEDLTIALSGLRALLVTPAGPVELGGDVLLRRGRPVEVTLQAQPALLMYQGHRLRLTAADLHLFPSRGDYGFAAGVSGALDGPGFQVAGMTARMSASRLKWDGQAKSFTAPRLQLHIAATQAGGGIAAVRPVLDLVADGVEAALDGTGLSGRAVLRLHAGADLPPLALGKRFPVLLRDPRLLRLLENNLQHLELAADAEVARKAGALSLRLAKPLEVHGAKSGALKLTNLELAGPPSSLHGAFNLEFGGAGLPALSLAAHEFHWQDGAFTSDMGLKARFDFAMLRGANIAANGKVSFRDGAFAFDLGACAPASLAAFHPGDSDMARQVRGSVCAVPGMKSFTADASGWRFSAQARNAAMIMPLGDLQFEQGRGQLAFSGTGDVILGKVQVTAARMRDHAPAVRFAPMNGTGEITLKDWVWRGDFVASDSSGIRLGTARFSHVLAKGSGEMLIRAPNLEFAEGKLQPSMLSPLLGAVARAKGRAAFDGVLEWSKAGIGSHGTLALDSLDFLTPLGIAHAINARIVLNSLLPPVTAPGQHIAVSKIDWTLPLSAIGADFSFGGGTLKLDSFSTNIAEGNLRLGNLMLNLAGPSNVKGTADLKSISLSPLVAASNLSGKIRLEGKLTGTVPFTYGPEGFRITNGHLAADGPGRISLDRSVWNQGGAAVNAVQDLAYQAMENLAYDQMSADINSIAGGRLQVVFHVKGRSDPPKPQEARVAVEDLLNGSALQKPIDLPSGTPIDLTLDTSLNFDELLKSYGEAWSKTLGR